ncbi:ThiF family protein [Trichuris suis]|nr:ThiF family protein [Trichuris suis]
MYEIRHSFSADELKRYGRQLILPELGVVGQTALKNFRVLIVGAGGLGCPCAIYLAAAGIGKIGIIDGDVIEESNLHRQILHTEDRIGKSKADSIRVAVEALNSNVSCQVYGEKLTSDNALNIVSSYDVVCDCSDNAPTRYLLNDVCVIAKKVLISGSALRWEGQLTTYSAGKGPCYRCLYPKPPPPELVTSCAQGGVLGTVPGTIGTLQANEVIKVAAGLESSYVGRLLVFDGLDGSFRTVKLRPRDLHCAVCGDSPTIRSPLNYEKFCGSPLCDSVRSLNYLNSEDRISVQQLKDVLYSDDVLVIDCRPSHQWDIGHFSRAINIPLETIESSEPDALRQLLNGHPRNAFVICHRGNQSQVAVACLRSKLGHSTEWRCPSTSSIFYTYSCCEDNIGRKNAACCILLTTTAKLVVALSTVVAMLILSLVIVLSLRIGRYGRKKKCNRGRRKGSSGHPSLTNYKTQQSAHEDVSMLRAGCQMNDSSPLDSTDPSELLNSFRAETEAGVMTSSRLSKSLSVTNSKSVSLSTSLNDPNKAYVADEKTVSTKQASDNVSHRSEGAIRQAASRNSKVLSTLSKQEDMLKLCPPKRSRTQGNNGAWQQNSDNSNSSLSLSPLENLLPVHESTHNTCLPNAGTLQTNKTSFLATASMLLSEQSSDNSDNKVNSTQEHENYISRSLTDGMNSTSDSKIADRNISIETASNEASASYQDKKTPIM